MMEFTSQYDESKQLLAFYQQGRQDVEKWKTWRDILVQLCEIFHCEAGISVVLPTFNQPWIRDHKIPVKYQKVDSGQATKWSHVLGLSRTEAEDFICRLNEVLPDEMVAKPPSQWRHQEQLRSSDEYEAELESTQSAPEVDEPELKLIQPIPVKPRRRTVKRMDIAFPLRDFQVKSRVYPAEIIEHAKELIGALIEAASLELDSNGYVVLERQRKSRAKSQVAARSKRTA